MVTIFSTRVPRQGYLEKVVQNQFTPNPPGVALVTPEPSSSSAHPAVWDFGRDGIMPRTQPARVPSQRYLRKLRQNQLTPPSPVWTS